VLLRLAGTRTGRAYALGRRARKPVSADEQHVATVPGRPPIRNFAKQLSGPEEDFLGFEQEVAFLHDLEPETLAFEFLRPVYDHTGVWHRDSALLERDDVREHVRRRCGRLGEENAALASLIFEDPAELGRRFCALLERYWEAAFEEEWQLIEPILVEALEEAGVRLATDGVLGFLADLRPHLRVEAERRQAWLKIPHEHEVALSPREPLVLSPSYFV
jgi:hypothetical protein